MHPGKQLYKKPPAANYFLNGLQYALLCSSWIQAYFSFKEPQRLKQSFFCVCIHRAFLSYISRHHRINWPYLFFTICITMFRSLAQYLQTSGLKD
jgi:hypothetical protein